VQLQTTKPTSNQEVRPSFSTRVYELRDKFGPYRNVGLSAKTSKGTTLIFQTPHT
jgi:hypothetical protein